MLSTMFVRAFSGVFLSLVLVLFSTHISHAAPSFSCEKASTLEKVICDDAALSQKDKQLADFYSVAYHHAIGDDTNSIVATQRQWISFRNKMCAKDLTAKCLNGYYNLRLFNLAVNNLFIDHDNALAEIAKQQPELKNIYQAIYDYVTIDDKHKRAKAVAANLGDAFDTLSGQLVMQDLPDITAVTRSPENVGALLWSISAYQYGKSVYPLLIPCDAFIKRPETIVWLEPRAGGAIDSQSPYSKCEEVMPALKHVTVLVKKADEQVNAEGGTIRFSIGATGEADFNAILTHSLEALHRNDRVHVTKVSDDMKVFLNSNASEVAMAQVELSHYYQTYFHVPANSAEKQAQHDLDLILSDYIDGGS